MYEVVSYLFYIYSLMTQLIFPCPLPEQLPANTVNLQQYLGTWYFKAAVSHKESDIHRFKVIDNILFTITERANNTLLLTGHMRVGDNCINQTWTYHIYSGREDLELEGRLQRTNLLWSGSWANCTDCILFQEIEPPLTKSDTTDSLNRIMLYSRRPQVDSEVVTTFLENAACNGMKESVTLAQAKEFCS